MKFSIRKQESWGYQGEEMMMFPSFWHNTGVWWTDRQTYRHIAVTKTHASI